MLQTSKYECVVMSVGHKYKEILSDYIKSIKTDNEYEIKNTMKKILSRHLKILLLKTQKLH